MTRRTAASPVLAKCWTGAASPRHGPPGAWPCHQPCSSSAGEKGGGVLSAGVLSGGVLSGV